MSNPLYTCHNILCTFIIARNDRADYGDGTGVASVVVLLPVTGMVVPGLLLAARQVSLVVSVENTQCANLLIIGVRMKDGLMPIP